MVDKFNQLGMVHTQKQATKQVENRYLQHIYIIVFLFYASTL